MKARILPTLAIAVLALAGCSTGSPQSDKGSSSNESPSTAPSSTQASASPRHSAADSSGASFNSDSENPSPSDQPNLPDADAKDQKLNDHAQQVYDESKGDTVELKAHSDKPATVTVNGEAIPFTGDWERTVHDASDTLYSLTVSSDDGEVTDDGEYKSDNNMTCSITADGEQIDQNQDNFMAMCMQVKQ